jgi:hypothetical protein
MKISKIIWIVLSIATIILSSGCGSSGNSSSRKNTSTSASIAIEVIKSYAQDENNPIPTIKDYIDVGVIGVTDENLDELNTLVSTLEVEDVDTKEELNEIVSGLDALGININPALSIDDEHIAAAPDSPFSSFNLSKHLSHFLTCFPIVYIFFID